MKRSSMWTARSARLGSVGAALFIATTATCKPRDSRWDLAPSKPAQGIALAGAVALLDAPAARVLLLSVAGDLEVSPVAYPLGPGFVAAAATPDGERLLALTRGTVPRRSSEDPRPALSVFAGRDAPETALLARYELTDPLSGLAVDPLSQYAVVYASPTDSSFVQNPNELVVIDLAAPPSAQNPLSKTLRSFGSAARELTFTAPLGLPGGTRRLLVVETERDLHLVDFSHLELPEITVRLTSGSDSRQPAGVAVSDGDEARDDDARIAVRLAGDPNVILIDLLPVSENEVATTPQSYRALPNEVYVGGVPSEVAFVRTDGGLRLAALLPAQRQLTLVNPATGIAAEIDLGAGFDHLSLVTNVVGLTPGGADVALLWSSSGPSIAFVALGATMGQPYKSVELLPLGHPVGTVSEVPAPNDHLRILTSPDGTNHVVLDLLARTASPIWSRDTGSVVMPSRDGLRAWIHASGSSLAKLNLESLHPQNLELAHPIRDVFDIERADGGRALFVLHDSGALGFTLLDAFAPDAAYAREYLGVALGEFE